MAVQTRMTASEFLNLPESNLPVELIDGEVVMSPTPVPGHQTLVLQLAIVIRSLGEEGKVYVAPLDVYLDDDNVVQPDVLWIGPASRCEIGEKHLSGAPDLVVEVLSPSTAQRDKITKFRLYEKHGVREYWIVDPTAQYIEVFNREETRFQLEGIFAPGETFPSKVLFERAVDVSVIFA
jgi:Uma2 family endonuclease